TPPPTVLYTLSLHDALPISRLICEPISRACAGSASIPPPIPACTSRSAASSPTTATTACTPTDPTTREGRTTRTCGRRASTATRSEEHTSELQSRENLVCRL